MTIREIQDELLQTLTPAVGIGEARSMLRIIIEDTTGLSRLKILTNPGYELTPDSVERMRQVAARVVASEPVQYALGVAQFRGRMFGVRPGVLIPRPETAQLVDLVVDACHDRKDLRVLDIGTGSGCIAISLALDLPFARVSAIDVSQVALDQAADNARRLKAEVRFILGDILGAEPLNGPFDVIVSNPPYVMQKERTEMEARVIDHEPEQALFVPDDDPLLFYRAIADKALAALTPGGMLFFEINPLTARELRAMLERMGYQDVEIIRDAWSKQRFATAKR